MNEEMMNDVEASECGLVDIVENSTVAEQVEAPVSAGAWYRLPSDAIDRFLLIIAMDRALAFSIYERVFSHYGFDLRSDVPFDSEDTAIASFLRAWPVAGS